MAGKYTAMFADPRGSIIGNPTDGEMLCFLAAPPTDGAVGYRKGCIFIDVDAAEGAQLYINVGTLASANFDALQALTDTEQAFLSGVTAGTAAASKALVLGATKNIDSFRMTGKLFTPQAAPEVATDTAALTDAQMLTGILVATPTAAAAYTVRTGTQLVAAVLSAGHTLVAGDCFDLTIINLGGSGDDITLTAATDITIVGNPVVTVAVPSQGTFRFRYTTGVVFVAYRVS